MTDLLIVFSAKYFFLVSILLLGWFFFRLEDPLKKNFISLSFGSFALSFVLAKIFSMSFNDPRPFVSEHITPLITHIADNGFPSDHTLLTMAIASIVFVYNRKLGIVLGAISLIVGIARVMAGVHHPIDIIGGIIIAMISTFIVNFIMRKTRYS